MQQGGITALTFILPWYWRSIACRAIYISTTVSEGSFEGEGFQNSQGWPFRFFPIGYVIFCPIGNNCLSFRPCRRVKWLPYQRSWHSAVEKYQERRRTHRALSTTYAKVWQVSESWVSWARAISFQNHPHKWPTRARSSCSWIAFTVHQYLNHSQFFIEPDRVSVLSVFLDGVCVRISAL